MPEWFYINKYNLCANFAINSQRVLVFYVSYTFIKVTLLSGGGIGNFIRSLYTYGTINIVRLYKQRTVIFLIGIQSLRALSDSVLIHGGDASLNHLLM